MTSILSVIGTMTYAACGGIVALEEEYDLLGVLALGMAQAFGGGIIRDLMIRAPSSALWDQGVLVTIAAVSIGLLHLLPHDWLAARKSWRAWVEAAGLAGLAIQGALFADGVTHSLLMTMAASALTATGGGVVRDLMARRRPAVFQHDNVYLVWALAAGGAIGLGWPTTPWGLALLFALIVGLRLVSISRKWRNPIRRLEAR